MQLWTLDDWEKQQQESNIGTQGEGLNIQDAYEMKGWKS